MKDKERKIEIPNFDDINESDYGSTLKLALGWCERLGEQLLIQSEQIQKLKDELSILKGEKARPRIKPSTVNKDNNDRDGHNGSGGRKGKRGKPSRKKTGELEIHEEVIIHPDNIPEGSVFKGYEDYVVQDIEIKPKNIKYRRARYETPQGARIVGALPPQVSGSHFGSILKSYILSQHYEQHVTQPLLLQQLRSFGIQISAGQLCHILTEGHESFHQEKEEILLAGLEVSSYINVDDTGARHQGKNGVSTHIGNELFAWFSSTESKSRVNFLELLRCGDSDYVIDDLARQYMTQRKLPKSQLILFAENRVIVGKDSWEDYLKSLGICQPRHITIATEGALFSSIIAHGLSPNLVIISDDAGQFNVAGFLNALCWVHAERTINKIIPYADTQREALKTVQNQIWNFYQQLTMFKIDPSDESRSSLRRRFDEIFSQKTSFQTLNLALKRIKNNKTELLLVLERPEIPLHNNLSESDIRDYVKKRKISATTRSENGRKSRDTFLSLKKTCYKLGISFWEFLIDRIDRCNNIPYLPTLIRNAAARSP